MYLVKALSLDKGSSRYTMYLAFSPQGICRAKGQIHCVSARPLVPREGLYQKFRKGVGGQRGLARGSPSKARDSGLFSVPFFLCPLRRRRTNFRRTFWTLFEGLFVANPLPPTPFQNLRLYQLHGQSLNTHRGKHRSGGAQGKGKRLFGSSREGTKLAWTYFKQFLQTFIYNGLPRESLKVIFL